MAEEELQQQQQQQVLQEEEVDEASNDDVFHNMFDDLNALRMAEADHLVAQQQPHGGGEDTERARAELLMNKVEPILPLQREDRSYNNPLEWW